MCGILGSINLPFGEDLLDTIAHRGPDGFGIQQETCGKHLVRLGHRRLAIVDLSEAGAQPMSLAGGKKHLVFNGEIYNHMAIREALSGASFRGHSDTETVLRALDAFGLPAVERLNGIFGFAYLDQSANSLVLARDPFGVKPVYYTSTENTFAFSSELEPLRRLVPTEVDTQALGVLLKLRYCPSPMTLNKGIRRLRPGHLLEVDLGAARLTVRERPYIGRVEREASPVSFEEAVEEYGRLFEQAVARQLMSDVEVGVLLSGGVDSALVAACAQRQSSTPLKALPLGWDATPSDEVDDARETVSCSGWNST